MGDDRGVPAQVAVNRLALRQPLDVPVRICDTAVRTGELDDIEVVVLQWVERRAVRRADVVALEELLDEHLPVEW